MIRTAFAFVKWGFIFSLFGVLAGYVLANGGGGANRIGSLFAAGGGILPAIGGMILGMLNGNSNDGSSSSTRRNSRTSRSKSQQKPKSWDSWDQHQQWQYSENAAQQGGNAPDIQQVMSEILGATQKVVQGSGFWDAAKSAANDFVKRAGEESGSRRARRKAKGGSKSTASR